MNKQCDFCGQSDDSASMSSVVVRRTFSPATAEAFHLLDRLPGAFCRSACPTCVRRLHSTHPIFDEKRIGSLRGSLDQIRRDARHGLTGEEAGEIAMSALREDEEKSS